MLMEASTQEGLASWPDRDELVRVWPDLYLPRDIRAAWQARHPVLAAHGAGPHVPQPLPWCRASGNSLVLASRNSLVVRGVCSTESWLGWLMAAG